MRTAFPRERLPLPAGTTFLLTRFVWGLLFAMMSTVSMIYQVEVAGLNPLELVLVGTALELSAFLFEIPTGLVADNYSRKWSVIIGFVITGISFIWAALVPTFVAIAAAAFLWGIGWTFISGAHEAWLADEVGESEAARLYLRGQKILNYGSFIGILIAILIGSLEIYYPFVLSGVLFVIWGTLLIFLMPETGFAGLSVNAPDQDPSTTLANSLSQMGALFSRGLSTVRGSEMLILLMVVGLVFGAFSEGYDRLSTAHLLRNFVFPGPYGVQPVVVFGLLGALGSLLAIAGLKIVEARIKADDARDIAKVLSIATTCLILLILVFALTNHIYLALGMFVLMVPLRSVMSPLTLSWLNKFIPAGVRATVLSMHSQADAVGQIGGGPGVGLIGREFGIKLALLVSGLILMPAVYLYRLALRRSP